VNTRESRVIGMLDRLSELPPEIFRTVEYNGDMIRLHQWASKCSGEVAQTHEPYCRLSAELDESPPAGWFWLKHWSENEPFVAFLLQNDVIELHDTAERATGYVVARAARLKVKIFAAEIHGA
jgi:hypothetical protein